MLSTFAFNGFNLRPYSKALVFGMYVGLAAGPDTRPLFFLILSCFVGFLSLETTPNPSLEKRSG